MKNFRLLLLSFAVCCIASSLGCNNNPLGRLPLSGTVNFGGKPLEKGEISFRPVERGVSTGAPIVNGKYSIAPLDGAPPGKYEVRIYYSEPDDSPLPEGVAPGGMRPAKEMIPPEYNIRTTQTVEVKKGEPNVFNFDIPKS